MVAMRRLLLFAIAATACAQTTPPPDTQALQALVAEIRQLRIDMQTTTITTQRVQIVLYRLQSQTALVTRANSHLEDVRSSLGNVQSEKKNFTARLQEMEDHLRSAQAPAERKILEESIASIKPGLERVTSDEQRQQSRLVDAETQYRAEQGKLAELQDQLDRLDKVLDSLSRK
jgi:chromosome segregation ATPase